MSEHEREERGAIAVRPKGEQRLEAGVADGNKVLAPADWQMLSAIAETVNNTEFVPEKLRGSAPRVLACILYGHALNVSPMIALKEIAVIDGTPSMSSALMVAKVLEAGHVITREEIRDPETGDMTGTTAHGRRSDGREDSFTFTINMARRAGLMSKKNWQNYPEAMLWWRASSQLCSFLFPDVFMGSPYMPEELGADTPVDAALEVVHGAEDELRRGEETLTGGAVSPSAVENVAAGRDQDEPVPAPEGPQGEPVVAKTAEEVAAQLTAKLQKVAAAPQEPARAPAPPALTVVVDAEAEDFWTPLDERDPTETEYLAAKTIIAQARPDLYPDEQTMADELDAAQVLVEAYEQAHPEVLEGAGDEGEQGGLVVKGTVAEVMLEVVAATERRDVAWLESVLAQERSSSRPRIRLVAGLEEALATITDTPAPLIDVLDEQQPPFTPGAAEEEVEPGTPTDEQLESLADPDMQVKHRFDASVPVDELDHEQLVVRVRAVTAYMAEQHPKLGEWSYEGVVTAAGKLWKLPVESLDDLEDWQLKAILSAAPEDATKVLEIMGGEKVYALAATAPGSNPS